MVTENFTWTNKILIENFTNTIKIRFYYIQTKNKILNIYKY